MKNHEDQERVGEAIERVKRLLTGKYDAVELNEIFLSFNEVEEIEWADELERRFEGIEDEQEKDRIQSKWIEDMNNYLNERDTNYDHR